MLRIQEGEILAPAVSLSRDRVEKQADGPVLGEWTKHVKLTKLPSGPTQEVAIRMADKNPIIKAGAGKQVGEIITLGQARFRIDEITNSQ